MSKKDVACFWIVLLLCQELRTDPIAEMGPSSGILIQETTGFILTEKRILTRRVFVSLDPKISIEKAYNISSMQLPELQTWYQMHLQRAQDRVRNILEQARKPFVSSPIPMSNRPKRFLTAIIVALVCATVGAVVATGMSAANSITVQKLDMKIYALKQHINDIHQTLGHLEKAVVLELTLKHVQALSSLIEQQQKQILSLQNGSSSESSKMSGEEMFLSGFQLCAEEALRFLQGGERRELVTHLHRVVSDLSRSPPRSPKLSDKPAPKGQATNCVPVIRRAAPLPSGEQSGTDTDTDSGYGGEVEKAESTQEQSSSWKEVNHSSPSLDRVIKQEKDEIPKKRPRMDTTIEQPRLNGNDLQSIESYPGHPLCLPFYLIPPSASAYLPMLEKCWYPGSMPMLYPSLSHSGLLTQNPSKKDSRWKKPVPQNRVVGSTTPMENELHLNEFPRMAER
ncbi:class E basic helix-loop-helix 40, partial, partial [Pelobates cultripes]